MSSSPLDALSRFLYDINKYYISIGIDKNTARAKTVKQVLDFLVKFSKNEEEHQDLYMQLYLETLSKLTNNIGLSYTKKLEKNIKETNQEQIDKLREKIFEIKEFKKQIDSFIKKKNKEK
jgi:hypothetical protein